MIYSIYTPKTNGVRGRSLKISTGAKHRHILSVFFCALLARLYSLWAGASVGAFMRTGYQLSQTSNPLATRPPYFEVGKAGLFNISTGGTQS